MATKRVAKHVNHVKRGESADPQEIQKPLTDSEMLHGLIHFLKDHGIHYDGSRAPEDGEDIGEAIPGDAQE